MQYSKIRDVKDINRGTTRSAGIDFYVPVLGDAYLFDVAVKNKQQLESDMLYIDRNRGVIILCPGAHVLLPSGIRTNLETVDGALYDENHGIAFIAYNKSSIALTVQLTAGAEVVDEDYQGELHLSVINSSNRLIKIESNMKLLQLIQTPILVSTPRCVPDDQLFNKTSERGSNGFGHTTDASIPVMSDAEFNNVLRELNAEMPLYMHTNAGGTTKLTSTAVNPIPQLNSETDQRSLTDIAQDDANAKNNSSKPWNNLSHLDAEERHQHSLTDIEQTSARHLLVCSEPNQY
jgi:dUTPase